MADRPNIPTSSKRAYAVPAGEARFAQEIKKSRFIGIATHAASSEEVTRVLGAFREEFPDATHHCWAYVLGNPGTSTSVRADDDGEPSGTAGKPILNVVQHKNVGDIVVVVVRYFGGTKLGAGGLVRAYTSTASGVMDALTMVTRTPLTNAQLCIDYAQEKTIRRLLDELDVTVTSVTYGERIDLSIRFPEDSKDGLANALATETNGRVKL